MTDSMRMPAPTQSVHIEKTEAPEGGLPSGRYLRITGSPRDLRRVRREIQGRGIWVETRVDCLITYPHALGDR